jgi:hypothetical protein
VYASNSERLGMDGRVHLIEQQPQCCSAAEVSRW